MSPARWLPSKFLLPVGARRLRLGSAACAHVGGWTRATPGWRREIVFGVLRLQAQLDFLITALLGPPAERLDPEVRLALRMGIYQLRYLERVPAHAAVGESVELVKRARKTSAAGLVNAVLRKVNRDPVAWPDRATELSIPPGCWSGGTAQYGAEAAAAIARANLTPPETYVRMPPGALRPSGAEAGGRSRLLPRAGRRTGPLRMQDIGSQSIVPLLDLEPGQTFLDLCAAPGNKTAQALEAGRARGGLRPAPAAACGHAQGLAADLVVLDGTQPLPFRRTLRPHPGGRALLRHRARWRAIRRSSGG